MEHHLAAISIMLKQFGYKARISVPYLRFLTANIPPYEMMINTTSRTDATLNRRISQRSNTQTPKYLPPEFYECFLSDVAKEMEHGPPGVFVILVDGIESLSMARHWTSSPRRQTRVIFLLRGNPNDAIFPLNRSLS